MLRVLGKSTSINVRKVLWVCDELGLPYALEPWGSGWRDPVTPEFIALNPNAQVPVLCDGDFVLWESNTICRYLAARAGRHDLLPEEPRARALVEQWMDWQATDLNSAWRYAFMARVRQHPDFTDAGADARSVAQWNRLMALLDRHLAKTAAFVVGERFTLADVVLALSINRWRMTPIVDRPTLAAVDRYYAALAERSGFRQHCDNGSP